MQNGLFNIICVCGMTAKMLIQVNLDNKFHILYKYYIFNFNIKYDTYKHFNIEHL